MLDTAETSLVVIPDGMTALQVFAAADTAVIDHIMARVRVAIDEFPTPDMSTVDGRKTVASMARKVVTAKTTLEAIGKSLAAEQKEIPKRIDATRRHIATTLDSWRDHVRAPLTAWEAIEATRQKKHADALAVIADAARPYDANGSARTSEHLRAMLTTVQSIPVDATCEEYIEEYRIAHIAAIQSIQVALAAREKHEAEHAELAQFRADAAARETAAREERLRQEGEDRARIKAEDAARADQQRAVLAIEAERAAALAREQQLIREAEAATRAAEAAIQKAAADAAEAKRRADADTAAREADTRHRRKIHKAAVGGMVAGGIDEDVATEIVRMLAAGKIPHVAISY